MSTPDQPIDLRDFTADVATQTGASAEELTERSDGTVSRDSDLFERSAAERELGERIAEVLWQYDTERKRVVGWLEGSADFNPPTHELMYVGERLAPVPTFEQIQDALNADLELYAKKIAQGFTKLLIVPFGARISTLLDQYQQDVTIAFEAGALLDADGAPIEDIGLPGVTEDPAFYATADTGKRLSYDEDGIHDHMRTKDEEVAAQPLRGWQVLLVEDIDESGSANASSRNSATIIDSGMSPFVSMQTRLDAPSGYMGTDALEQEVFLTLESYLALAHRYLCDERKLLDIDGTTKLLGSYSAAERTIPWICRNRVDMSLRIDEIRGDLGTQPSVMVDGIRTAVMVDMLPAVQQEEGATHG